MSKSVRKLPRNVGFGSEAARKHKATFTVLEQGSIMMFGKQATLKLVHRSEGYCPTWQAMTWTAPAYFVCWSWHDTEGLNSVDKFKPSRAGQCAAMRCYRETARTNQCHGSSTEKVAA